MSQRLIRFTFAASLAALTAVFAAPAAVHAQDLFLTSASYTANDATYQNDTIHVGLDNGFSRVDGGNNPYVASLNVVAGGDVRNAFGYNSNTTNISGGTVSGAYRGFDTSIGNVSGGDLTYVLGYDNSTLNISGGNIYNVTAAFNSTTNISGGNFIVAGSDGNNTTNVSGGTFTNGIFISTGTANFISSAPASFAYVSYGFNNVYNEYVDFFQVSGTFGGVEQIYDLYIRNDNGSGVPSTPNPAQRQFSIAVVPEANTFALALPALGMIGAVVIKRRKNA